MRAWLAWFASVFLLSLPAAADQTDPALGGLFETLRSGDAIAAEETAARIRDIWSVSQSDTVNLLYERAFTSAAAGRYELALALCDHVVGLAPNFAQGYALRGVVKNALRDPEGAALDFEKTLALEPRQFEARSALAELLLSAGKTREAYDMLQEALKWNPHDADALERARRLRESLARQDT
jgi:tetratricopeptide (TPR) repeat protein